MYCPRMRWGQAQPFEPGRGVCECVAAHGYYDVFGNMILSSTHRKRRGGGKNPGGENEGGGSGPFFLPFVPGGTRQGGG